MPTNNEQEDKVIAPGGRRRRDQFTKVGAGEAVKRSESGTYEVVTVPGQIIERSAKAGPSQSGFVICPGGYRYAANVHLIEPGHAVNTAGARYRSVDSTGRLIADFGKLRLREGPDPLMPRGVAVRPQQLLAAGPVPGLGEGWITNAQWTNFSGTPLTLFRTSWIVPPAPTGRDGQLVYLFNGIQNATMIYQPVLQWGPSPAGGGDFWGIASWYADGQSGQAFHSMLTPVAPGQKLVGVMRLTGQQTILSDRSPESPSLASLNGRLYLAWKGDGNDNLNVMYSADNGTTFGNKHISNETSPEEPALCVHNGQLYIAWKGDGNDNLNVARVNVAGSTITGITNKVTLPERSPESPALASFNGRLYLAWKGDGNDNLNVMYSADDGATFGNKHTSGETSPEPPALCVHSGQLYIAWKGDGNNFLNVARVSIRGTTITGLTNKVTLQDRSPENPSLASLNGRLYIGWKGDGNEFLNVMYSADNGATFTNKFTSSETSPQTPALAVHNGQLYIAWKGVGNDFLNVARLSP